MTTVYIIYSNQSVSFQRSVGVSMFTHRYKRRLWLLPSTTISAPGHTFFRSVTFLDHLSFLALYRLITHQQEQRLQGYLTGFMI